MKKKTDNLKDLDVFAKYTSEQLFEIADAKKEQEDRDYIKCKFFTCGKCKKSSQMNKWERVHNHWHEDCPYTPNWRSDGEMRVICPKCRFLNRILQKSYYDYRKERTVTEPHPLRDKIEEFLRRGGKLAKAYKTYMDYNYSEIYEINPDGNIWDNSREIKLKALPYKDTINV